MIQCSVCGNELNPDVVTCPYCGTQQEKQGCHRLSEYKHKHINLEIGRPFVEQALAKLQTNIDIAKMEKVQVLTIIHGYGSSGRGGKIRIESRKLLDYLVQKKVIQSYIPGEDFNRKAGPVSVILRRFPQLNKHRDLNRNNPGISIVIL